MDQVVRIDKWLWAVRIYKSRTIAADECRKGRISIGEIEVKPSRAIRVGDILEIKKQPITYSFRVLQLAEKRMAAKLVPGFVEDLTSKEQFTILEMKKYMQWNERDKGTGRPTKKDRRNLDGFLDW